MNGLVEHKYTIVLTRKYSPITRFFTPNPERQFAPTTSLLKSLEKILKIFPLPAYNEDIIWHYFSYPFLVFKLEKVP